MMLTCGRWGSEVVPLWQCVAEHAIKNPAEFGFAVLLACAGVVGLLTLPALAWSACADAAARRREVAEDDDG